MKTIIHSYTDSAKAEAAVSSLAAAGITAALVNAGPETTRLCVREEDMVRARMILDAATSDEGVAAGGAQVKPAEGFTRREIAAPQQTDGAKIEEPPFDPGNDTGYVRAFLRGGWWGLGALAVVTIIALVVKGGAPLDPAAVVYVFGMGGLAGVFIRAIRNQRRRDAAALAAGGREETLEMELVSVKGPVELVDGKLTLMIPLVVGGDELAKCEGGIGEIVDEDLKVVIPEWLAEKLKIKAGSVVHVDNNHGKFNIVPVTERK